MKKKAIVSLFAACAILLAGCGSSNKVQMPITPAPSNTTANNTTSTTPSAPTPAPAPAPAPAPSAQTAQTGYELFTGTWENIDSSLWLQIDGDGSWAMYNSAGDVTVDGYLGVEGETAYLYEPSGSLWVSVSHVENGRLMDSNNDRYVLTGSLPSGSQFTYVFGDFIGLWDVQNDNYWIEIFSDGTWQAVNARGAVVYSGTTLMGNSEIELYHYDGTLYDVLTYYPDGTLHNASGGLLEAAQNSLDTGAQGGASDALAFFGSWNYGGIFNIYLYDDYTWGSWDYENEASPGEGFFVCNGDSVTLYFNDGSYYCTLSLYRGGDLIDENGNIYAPIDMTR